MLKEIDKNRIAEVGYLDIAVDSSIDLLQKIRQLKEKKNAIILAHYYQSPVIQDIADYVGDSLGLSRKAANTKAKMIVFAGVHFMAETAKIINPQKKVILPDLGAGCSLSDSCPPEKFREFVKNHPDHVVVSYINCSAEIKALSDIICTSSNAVDVIRSIPEGRSIIFAPDENLGRYIEKATGRKMVLWKGACIVHEAFSYGKVLNLCVDHPDAKIIAHPESEDYLLKISHFIGSTSQLLKFVRNDKAKKFIVATEAGILHQMTREVPDKILIPAPVHEDNTCACSECAFMKRNTLEKLYLCLEYELPEIQVPKKIARKAIVPIQRMLKITENAAV